MKTMKTTKLSKIDKLVKHALLECPTLFQNRFHVLAYMLTTNGGSYDWGENGEIVLSVGTPRKVTPEMMVQEFRDALREQVAKYGKGPVYMRDLYSQFVTDSMRDLHDAEFVAANIDVYAKTFCGSNYRDVLRLVQMLERDGVDNEYWPINNKPKKINEEWRLAIRTWLGEILPSLNSFYGALNEDGKWVAAGPKHAEVFDWLYGLYKKYETKTDRDNNRAQRKIAKEIVDRIKSDAAKVKGRVSPTGKARAKKPK